MIEIKNKTQLRKFIKTDDAFTQPFLYKGFQVWWNNRQADGVRKPNQGHFRADPDRKQVKYFYELYYEGLDGYAFDFS